MSFLDKVLAAKVFSGLGSIPPAEGAIPVLFGLRLIHEPRVVWIKTQDVLDSELEQVEGDEGQRFVLMAALCLGEINGVSHVFCNNVLLPSFNFNYDAESTSYIGRFEDPFFFDEEKSLYGYVGVFRGTTTQDLYNPQPTSVRTEHFRRLAAAGDAPALKPQYRGIAMAHLYVSRQANESTNTWSFLARRYPYAPGTQESPAPRWKEDKAAIPGPKQSVLIQQPGGEIRVRHIVLAIDASLINAFPTGLNVENLASTTARLRRQIRNRERGENTPWQPWEPWSSSDFADVRTGKFEYRYDVIRKGALAALDEFKQQLDSSTESFRFSLKILAFGIGVRDIGQGGTGVAPIDFTFEHESMDGRPFINTATQPDYYIYSKQTRSVNKFIAAAKAAIETSSYFREATASDRYVGLFNLFQSGRIAEWSSNTSRRDTKRLVRAYINPHYYRILSLASTAQITETVSSRTLEAWGLWTLATPRVFPFGEWGSVFDYIRTNNVTHFDQTSDLALRQVSFITGPSWPHVARPMTVFGIPDFAGGPFVQIRARTDLLPNINNYYLAGSDVGGLSLSFAYGDRTLTTAPFTALAAHMGAGYGFRSSTGNIQFGVDYVALDPFCWGSLPRPNTNFKSTDIRRSGTQHRSYSNWTIRDWDDYGTIGEYDRLTEFPTGVGTQPTYSNSKAHPPVISRLGSLRFYYQNTTASTDTNVIEQIAMLGERMGQTVRTKTIAPRRTTFNYSGANPVHIIRECLLNPDWGRGKVISESDLDNDSFEAVADILYEEEFGLGLIWNRVSTIDSFINDVLRHIDGILFQHYETKKIHLRLLGAVTPWNGRYFRHPTALSQDEITAAQNRLLNEHNVRALTAVKMPREDELVNRVIIQYQPYYAINTVGEALGNDVRIERYGLKSKSIEYKGIMDAKLAGTVARRDLIQESAGLISCHAAVLPSFAARLNPSDVVRLSWTDLNIELAYMRVMKIVRSSSRHNTVRLELLQTNAGTIVDRP